MMNDQFVLRSKVNIFVTHAFHPTTNNTRATQRTTATDVGWPRHPPLILLARCWCICVLFCLTCGTAGNAAEVPLEEEAGEGKAQGRVRQNPGECAG